MGKKVSAAQAARLTGRHESVIRRDIRKHGLPALQQAPGMTWLIDVDDLRRFYGIPLREEPSAEGQLAALREEVRDLRRRVEQLEARQVVQPPAEPESFPAVGKSKAFTTRGQVDEFLQRHVSDQRAIAALKDIPMQSPARTLQTAHERGLELKPCKIPGCVCRDVLPFPPRL